MLDFKIRMENEETSSPRGKINATEQPYQRKKLLDLCRTRWIARHEAMEIFGQFYSVIVDIFEDIRLSIDKSWNRAIP